MRSLSSPLPGQGPGTGASPVIFHPSPRCGNTPRHGKSLEGNKEDTWPVELGRLPAQGAASGSSPALLGRLGCLSSYKRHRPAASLPKPWVLLLQQLPVPTGLLQDKKGGKWPFCGVWLGFFPSFSLRRKGEGRTWHRGQSEGEVGNSGDVEVGVELSLYEALMAAAKTHISAMSERSFLRGQ